MPAKRLVLFIFVHGVLSFNLDDQHTVTFPSDAQIEISSDSSYFGYAVAFRSTDTSKTLVVSAPRYGGMGAVFECSLENLQCNPITVSNTTVEQERDILKDEAWIGSAIDVQRTGKGIVVCGSLLSSNHTRNNRWVNGGCYWKPDGDAERADLLVPLTDGDHLGHKVSGSSNHAYYANGQAGVSVLITQEGQELIIGAPGFDMSVGTILRYRIDENGNLDNGTIGGIQACQASGILGNEYGGYAVASGRFMCGSSIAYAVGAPRAAMYKGQVWLAAEGPLDAETGVSYERVAAGSGGRMGDGYGAALAAADVDGDGCDDLLVGAPRAGRADAGAVYLYFGARQGPNLRSAVVTLEGDGTPHAQFGTSVAAVGDIDGDGFQDEITLDADRSTGLPYRHRHGQPNGTTLFLLTVVSEAGKGCGVGREQDVAVGAPYGGRGGMVFLYLGSGDARRAGRLLGPQRLRSAAHPAATQPGFGISVAGGVDVDGNGYADVAVGSFAEGRARVFLARPAVALVASVSGPESLRLADRRTVITACLTYTSRKFQADVEAIMVFSGDGSADSRPVTISKGKTHCENVTWTIKARDKLQPVHVKMRGEIRDKNGAAFCGDCPVADPQRSVGGSVLIPFNTGCRNEARCESDLRLFVDASWQPSPVGQDYAHPVELVATLENAPGYDTAHVAGVELEATVLPPEAARDGLRLADSSGADCDVLPAPNASSIALRCRLRMLKMRPGLKETVRLQVAVQGQAAGVATLSWNATAFFRGHELTPEDNQWAGSLPLSAPAGIALTGGTEPRYISAKSDSRENYKFTQFFRVINAGAYRLQSFNLSLHLPLGLDYQGRRYGGIQYETPKTSTPNKVTCVTTSESSTSDAGTSQGTPGWISQITTAAFGNELRASADCYALDEKRCQTFECVAGPLEADRDSVDVSVTAVLLHRSIQDVISRADVDVIGRAWLHLPEEVLLASEMSSETNATTTILSPNIQRAAMARWVWIVLVVAALLIYAVMVAVFYKMGFFKRKKAEARRRQEEEEKFAEAEKLMEED